MTEVLVIGAGVTGGYVAARLHDHGLHVDLLVRGESAVRIAQEGLRLRDGMTGAVRTVELPLVTEPSIAGRNKEYQLIVVCVQEQQRTAAAVSASRLPGHPPVWFLGNTVQGFGDLRRVLGNDRVLGGFPDVGGIREGSELVFADRRVPKGRPFHSLVIGEACDAGQEACHRIQRIVGAAGFRVRRYQPIFAWHLCHAILVLPLAGLLYRHDGVLADAAADQRGLHQAVRAVSQGLRGLRQLGYPLRPRRMRLMAASPTWPGVWQLRSLLRSRFAEIALAGHARTARNEVRTMARELSCLLKDTKGDALRELLEAAAE